MRIQQPFIIQMCLKVITRFEMRCWMVAHCTWSGFRYEGVCTSSHKAGLSPRPKTNPSVDCFRYRVWLYWKRYMCRMRSGHRIVSVPDPKPTPARIAFSIARALYCKWYTRRMRSGDETRHRTNLKLMPYILTKGCDCGTWSCELMWSWGGVTWLPLPHPPRWLWCIAGVDAPPSTNLQGRPCHRPTETAG